MKKGMRVLVGNDLTKSFGMFGQSRTMNRMKGKTFTIKSTIGSRGITLELNDYTYSFSIDDVTPVIIKKKKISPELFDPKQLINNELPKENI